MNLAATMLRPTVVVDVRAAILAAAREHVLAFPTIAAALRDCDHHVELDLAMECLQSMLGRPITVQERLALIRAIRATAHAEAERILNDESDEDHAPEAWGTLRQSLERALDLDRESVFSCDACDGRGHDENGDRCCHGGLSVAPEAASAELKRLAEEAIAMCVKPALVTVEMPEPKREVA